MTPGNGVIRGFLQDTVNIDRIRWQINAELLSAPNRPLGPLGKLAVVGCEDFYR